MTTDEKIVAILEKQGKTLEQQGKVIASINARLDQHGKLRDCKIVCVNGQSGQT